MTIETERMIEWLAGYCEAWDVIQDQERPYLSGWMSDVLYQYCSAKGLPFMSADELIAELENGAQYPRPINLPKQRG